MGLSYVLHSWQFINENVCGHNFLSTPKWMIMICEEKWFGLYETLLWNLDWTGWSNSVNCEPFTKEVILTQKPAYEKMSINRANCSLIA